LPAANAGLTPVTRGKRSSHGQVLVEFRPATTVLFI
jgi:hypothetical protein